MLPRHKALLGMCTIASRGELEDAGKHGGPLAAPSVLLKSPAAFEAYLQRYKATGAGSSRRVVRRAQRAHSKQEPLLRRANRRCNSRLRRARRNPTPDVLSKAKMDGAASANTDVSEQQRGRGNAHVRL
jgi:hypothetical protein